MQPTEDERVLAALSHACIVANIVNLVGMIATALIWTMQRDRSRFVRAHALQSLVYQGAVLLIGVFLTLAWGLCIVLSLLPVFLKPELYQFSSPPSSFWFALFGVVVPTGFVIAAMIYGLYGAYQVYRGRPFYYPIAGRVVRGELSQATAATLPTPPAEPAAAPPTGIYEAPPATSVGDGETPLAPDTPAAPAASRRSRRRPPSGRE
jgi:uncharacterized Tic20 family protein